jgi:tRNA threonylcarbamoyl adenosine modification protein (Sua5/YciO/YrdC/YwlC family)
LSAAELEQAVQILKDGGLVALPTETVYGLAADSCNDQAVEAIYDAKGRAEDKPLSVLVIDMDMVETVCKNIPPTAYRLAEKFWPGPLTLVLHSTGEVAPAVTAGGETLGVRCPDHPLTLEVVKRLGHPLAAPSANPSGDPSPKEAKDVFSGLDGRIDAVLDGGACTVAIESTIVDLTSTTPRILRQGGLAEELIWSVIRDEG